MGPMPLQDIPIVIADAQDQASIDAMVGKTDVIVGCAGPFEVCSGGVVDASVRLGTHYCDITGECVISPSQPRATDMEQHLCMGAHTLVAYPITA